MTTYSSIPKVYDSQQAEYDRNHDMVFGRRHSDPDLSAPQGSVNTRAYGTTDKLWIGANGTRDPKPLEIPIIEEPEDWRHQALPRTTYIGPGTDREIAHPIPPDTTVVIKHDAGKTDWSLMPFEAIEEINKVLDFGAKKYAAHNWRTGSGFKYTRVLSSLLRHTFAWARGEDLDPESGLSHLAHMGCNVVFLIYYNKYKARYSNDDREVSWTY